MKKIIEITSLQELIEMSTMSGGAVQGSPSKEGELEEFQGAIGGMVRNNDFYRGKDMRQELQTEVLLRQYIRKKIKEQIHEQLKIEQEQEHELRLVIRSLIKEAKEMANPHPNTGINKLRDAFRKAKPTLKSKYQQLTTSAEQRETFTSHMLQAFINLFDELDALQAQGEGEGEIEAANLEPEEPPAPSTLEAPPEDVEKEIEDMLQEMLNEIDVEIEDEEIDVVSDEEKEEAPKSQTQKDFEKKKEKEAEKQEFSQDLAGDATGRNQAFDTFRLVQSYFSDAYLDLSNEEDQKMYRDWCLYNLKLLFQNFEESLPTVPEAPSIQNPEGF
tara:strand:- start:4070 stop:5059 length:990 start_codon:yes stop_codon:yes gene_type:complete